MSDSDFGLLPEGLVTPSFDDTRGNTADKTKTAFGASTKASSDTSILGILIAIISEALARLWETVQAIDSSQDPDKASNAALDALAALTGTFRREATSSTATVTLTGTPGSTVPAVSIIATASTGKQFDTSSSAVIAALASWASAHAYVAGDRVTNGGNAYQCITSGTSAGSGGPTGILSDITDNTAHWTYLGGGTGAVDVIASCEATGPTVAVARDLTVIRTPTGGWTSAINLADAAVGRDVGTDAELRVDRETELAGGGSGTVDAIVAALEKGLEPDALSVSVFENVTDATDADGVLPHSIEALVDIPLGSTNDNRIAAILLAQVPAGTRTYSSSGEFGTAVDSEGISHTESFTRPTEVPIIVDITLTYDASAYPADGDAQVKAAIAAQARTIGLDAIASRIGAQAFKVAGVIDVPRSGSLGGCLIKSPSGTPTTDTTITITKRQVATYDTSNITVHSSAVTP